MNRRRTLVVLMIVALLALACSLTGKSGEEAAEPGSPSGSAGGSTTTTAEPTPPPEPEPEDTATRTADGMEVVLIAAGEFLMGDDASAFAPEKPGHMVFLGEYWIDRYEVTNAQYRLCLEAGVCPEPGVWTNADLSGDRQPVLVHWEAAKAYCEWAGGRLPTEAEWEKAIRGTDGRIWPWGNEFVNDRANLSGDTDGYGPTAPVGSFPDDVSPYGLFDAAGNAGEWVADWWDPEYYSRSPARNPTGPASGDKRVHRAPISNAGGGPEKSRCVARYAPHWDFGVRCVSATRPEG